MKVLLLLDSLNRGGAEMLALDVCRNASRHGLDIALVATGGGALESDFKTSGVEYTRIQRRLPVDFKVVARLRKIILLRKINIVHTDQAVTCLHAYLATIGADVRRVLTFQGHIHDKKNRCTLNYLSPRMDANLIVSHSLHKWLVEVADVKVTENVSILYNGADENRLISQSNNLRNELGLNKNTLLFSMIGNFYQADRKDQMTVCRALPKFFDAVPNAHFIFVGGHDQAREKYQACLDYCKRHNLGDRVNFLGSRNDVSGILNEIDVFVLSSIQEGLPITVIEAMILGKPCILSDIEPLLEISKEGKYAMMFKKGDENDLAEKMIDLASNADQRKKLGAMGKRLANDRYSIDAHLSSLKKLYESMF